MTLEQKVQMWAFITVAAVTVGAGGLLMFDGGLHSYAVSLGSSRDDEEYSIMGFLREIGRAHV